MVEPQDKVLAKVKERTESLYDGDQDAESLSSYTQKAARINKQACKITFSNIDYKVKVPTNKKER